MRFLQIFNNSVLYLYLYLRILKIGCILSRVVKIINYYEETILRHEHVDIIIYTFTSLERIQPIFRTPRIRRNPNSRYFTELLYICKNLTA